MSHKILRLPMRRLVAVLIAMVVSAWAAAPAAQAAKLAPIWHPELRQPTSVTDAIAIASDKNDGPAPAPTLLPGQVSPLSSRTCSGGWHYVQRDANSFVTGNCAGGWSMAVSGSRVEGTTGWTFYSGNISGSYNGCGWMRAQDLGGASGTATSSCGARAYCDFIYCDGAGNPYTYGTAGDGMIANAFGGCTEYANYRPWSTSSAPTDGVRATTTGNTVRIRYLAKYTYGGHRYYMARDTVTPAESGQANWVFIRDDCFA